MASFRCRSQRLMMSSDAATILRYAQDDSVRANGRFFATLRMTSFLVGGDVE